MSRKILILILPALIPLFFSCSGSSGKRKVMTDPVPVTVLTVKPQNAIYYETYPGTVTALKEVGLRGEVTGYITGIFFTEGAQVRRGQKLYEIDRRQYEAAYKEVSDNLDIAKQNLEKVQLDADRYSALNSQEAIARQQYDHAMTDLANARLQVSAASEEMEKARTNLGFSTITAPFDGTIGISQVKLGDLVTPGQTLLNTISSDDPMGVDFLIDQSELPRFMKLQLAKPAEGDTTFRLMLPGQVSYPFPGKLELIDRAVDPRTGTIKVRLDFPNHDRNLRPGMDGDVMVLQSTKGPQILVPFKAVVEQMGEYFVFVANNGKAREIRVATGARIGSEVIILKGLDRGDILIVDGIEKLADGAPVTTGTPRARSVRQ
jgi:RND family efflux transporter MFP subunit